jgi:hypothetical protein
LKALRLIGRIDQAVNDIGSGDDVNLAVDQKSFGLAKSRLIVSIGRKQLVSLRIT